MSAKLFVGNLTFTATENDLQDHFAQAGVVVSVNIMQDRMTGRSRGFAFIEMSSKEDAEKAIQMFHSKDFQGRPLTVNEARPREDRPPGGGGGGGGGYRGGGGGGGGGGYRGGGGEGAAAVAAAAAVIASFPSNHIDASAPAERTRPFASDEFAWIQNTPWIQAFFDPPVQGAQFRGRGQGPPRFFGQANAVFAGDDPLPRQHLPE